MPVLPVYIFLNRKKGYTFNLKERLVLYSDKEQNNLWFHCASVGELNVARPLIEYYKDRYNILITVFSPRGIDYAKKQYPYATVRTLPFDIPFLFKKFIKIYNPVAVVSIEGEFWFNFVNTAHRFIPFISANTRISDNSYKKYKRWRFFYKKIFNSIDLFLVRSDKDYQYLKDFVDNPEKIILCGDLKFISSKSKKDIKFHKKGKILIAGSTHAPEEKIILQVFKKLKEKYPDLHLIIAPRHLERIEEVKKLIENSGFSYQLRSKSDIMEKDIYLIDTIGELSGFYKYANLVFIGGTIANIGGHNVLEAALENKPVVIGKHYHKIDDIVKQLKDKIVFVAEDEKKLEDTISSLLNKGIENIDLSKEVDRIFRCYVQNINKVLGGKNG